MLKQLKQPLKQPRRLALLAVFGVPILVLFGDVLFGRAAVWGQDWIALFHPYVSAFSRRWQENRLALWTPEIGTGYPLFAEGQSLQLYPPMALLLRLLPFWWASGVLIAAHYFVAAVGTYAFCRRRGLPASASVLGALTFALSAALTWRAIHPTVVVTVSLMPVFLCAMDAALRARRAPQIAAAVAVLALQLLGGHHQFTFYSLGLALAYTLVLLHAPRQNRPREREEREREEKKKRPVRALALRALTSGAGIFLGVLVLAAGICALPLVATLEMRSETLRQVLPREALVTGFGLPLENLLLFFLPHLWGDAASYTGGSLLWESCGYSTILPFLLGLAALAARPRSRDLWFWLAVAGVSLALAIVEGNPLYKILPQVPVFNWFRVPARFLVLTAFALAMLLAHSFSILATLAMEKIEKPESARSDDDEDGGASKYLGRASQVLGGTTLLLFVLSALALVVFCDGQSVLWSALSGSSAGFYHPVRTRADVIFNSLAGWDGVFLFAHIVVGGGTMLLLLKHRVSPRMAGATLAILVSADLGRVAYTMRERVDPTYFSFEPATVAFIKRQPGLFRVWTGQSDIEAARGDATLSALAAPFVEKSFARPSQSVLLNLPHADATVGLDLLRPYNLVRSLALPPGGAFLSGTDAQSKSPLLLRPPEPALRARLLRLLNVRFAVSTAPFKLEGWRQVLPPLAAGAAATSTSSTSSGVQVWENRNVLPRAFLVGAVRPATPQTALETLLSDSLDPSRVAVVEEEVGQALPSEPPGDFSGTVGMQSYGDTRMTLETQCSRPSLLIVSDTWYPGWRAWVDGVEAPMMRANYALRGVALAPGRHHIVCAYSPRWWWPALALSALALGLTLALLFPAARRARAPIGNTAQVSGEALENP